MERPFEARFISGIVSARREKVFNEIPRVTGNLRLAGRHPNDTPATATLGSEFAFGSSFDVSAVCDRDNTPLVCDQILDVDFSLFRKNPGKAFATVFFFDADELILDDCHHAIGSVQDIEQIIDFSDDFTVLVNDFFAFEACQLVQTQIQNLVSLKFAEDIAAVRQSSLAPYPDADALDCFPAEFECEEFDARFLAIGRSADDVYKIIQMSQRNQIPLERFRARLGLSQKESGSAENDIAAMFNVAMKRFFE
jgi:hypothetical protein